MNNIKLMKKKKEEKQKLEKEFYQNYLTNLLLIKTHRWAIFKKQKIEKRILSELLCKQTYS